jgi:hypothetical protein
VARHHAPPAGLEAVPQGAGGGVGVVADEDGRAGLRACDGGDAQAGAVGRGVGGVGLSWRRVGVQCGRWGREGAAPKASFAWRGKGW